MPGTARQGARNAALPAALREVARARLGMVATCFLGMAFFTIACAAAGVLPIAIVAPMVANVLVSLTLLAAARSTRLSTTAAMRTGLIGLVAYCVVISFFIARFRYLHYGAPGDPTWTCVLLVTFPLLVPGRARPVALTLTLGALTGPLGALWVANTTAFELGGAQVFGYAISPSFSAFMGYLGSRYVYRLGLDVGRAQRLGSYRLVRQLGEGGMGEVWEAEHALLARPAAIKLIRSSESGGDPADAAAARRRFEREAAATAGLRSPHTVEVFDFGVSEDGRFYYAMELLDGHDLDALVRQHGPMPPERVVHVLRQLLHSLREAHTAGIVHRDIKPANVFLCHYGLDTDFVKVLDFGVARDLHATELLTSELHVPGTPSYMAPEAHLREAGIDERGDIYSVACLAFFLLTGRRVYEGPTAAAQIVAHATDPIPLVSDHSAYPVPKELERLLYHALAKLPEDRIPDATTFLRRLDKVTLKRRWTQARATRWWASHLSEHRVFTRGESTESAILRLVN